MATKHLPTIAIVFGTIALVLSWVLPSIVGGRQNWSDADAERLQHASARLHSLTYAYGNATQRLNADANSKLTSRNSEGSTSNPNSPLAELRALSEDLADAKEQYGMLEAKLSRAQTAGHPAAQVLKWVGITAVIIGAIGRFTNRSPGR